MNTICRTSKALKTTVSGFLRAMIAVVLLLLISGTAMNLTVVYLNDGYMPVSAKYEIAPSNRHKSVDEDTKLVFLTDKIFIPKWKNPTRFTRWVARNMNYPLTPAVASVGDLFIWTALAILHILVAITVVIYVPLKLVQLHCTPTRQ